jgi:hypothetical protein
MTDFTTIEGIAQHPDFIELTESQKVFLLGFFELNGDAPAATRIAYGGNPRTLEARARRLIHLPRIRRLISVHSGVKDIAGHMGKYELEEMIAARLRTERDMPLPMFRSLTRDLAILQGWHDQKAEDRTKNIQREVDDPRDVDSLVRKLEKEISTP